jgi:hypothetical protein
VGLGADVLVRLYPVLVAEEAEEVHLAAREVARLTNQVTAGLPEVRSVPEVVDVPKVAADEWRGVVLGDKMCSEPHVWEGWLRRSCAAPEVKSVPEVVGVPEVADEWRRPK